MLLEARFNTLPVSGTPKDSHQQRSGSVPVSGKLQGHACRLRWIKEVSLVVKQKIYVGCAEI